MPHAVTVVLACGASRHGTGGRIATWLAEHSSGPVHTEVAGPARNGAVVLVVPAYARPGELSRVAAQLREAHVALVVYGGMDRGAAVAPDVVGVLREAGADVIPFAVALNSALVRVGRFSEFDAISARLVLDTLSARAPDEHQDCS